MTQKRTSKKTENNLLRTSDSGDMKKNVLFIGAHPDDIELGGLGTIMRYTELENRNVFCLVASNGEAGLKDVAKPEKFSRMEESIKALTGAGVQEGRIRFLGKPDTLLSTTYNELLNDVESACKEWKIERVFMHTNKDRHQDHRTIYEVTIGAARFVPDIFTYESNSSTMDHFSPNFYIDISKWINKKVELLKHHESQIRQDRQYLNVDSVIAPAMTHAQKTKQRNVEAAEAFEIVRLVEFRR